VVNVLNSDLKVEDENILNTIKYCVHSIQKTTHDNEINTFITSLRIKKSKISKRQDLKFFLKLVTTIVL